MLRMLRARCSSTRCTRSPRAWAPLLRCRTLVLMGEQDRIVPMINGRFLARLIPRARLETVPGGHLFLVSQPDAVFPRITAFLSEDDAIAAAA